MNQVQKMRTVARRIAVRALLGDPGAKARAVAILKAALAAVKRNATSAIARRVQVIARLVIDAFHAGLPRQAFLPSGEVGAPFRFRLTSKQRAALRKHFRPVARLRGAALLARLRQIRKAYGVRSGS